MGSPNNDGLQAHEVVQIALPLGIAGLTFIGLIARSRNDDIAGVAFMVATLLGGTIGAVSTYHELRTRKATPQV